VRQVSQNFEGIGLSGILGCTPRREIAGGRTLGLPGLTANNLARLNDRPTPTPIVPLPSAISKTLQYVPTGFAAVRAQDGGPLTVWAGYGFYLSPAPPDRPEF
jgi:hypothetical protein